MSIMQICLGFWEQENVKVFMAIKNKYRVRSKWTSNNQGKYEYF